MNKPKFLCFLATLSILLGACAQAAPIATLGPAATPLPSAFAGPLNPTAAPVNPPTLAPYATPEEGAGATPQGGAGATPPLSASPTPPPDVNLLPTWTLPAPTEPIPTSPVRPPADKWQEWPVMPSVTATFVETYRKGLALGSDPHAFSKIGDCQSVVGAFLGVYDQPGVYALPKGQEYLQDTIDWFNGSWSRESQAVRGGFNVASVLSAFLADPAQCKPGETPLDCEFRQHRPSIVLISMETGFEGRTAAVYEKYMRKIIEYVLARGAAPILATKADNFEGDQSINLTTARLAVEYDLPLWNFWRAVQPLPDHGMDAVRNDKFHISVEAWNVRSYTALEVIDALWKAVKE